MRYPEFWQPQPVCMPASGLAPNAHSCVELKAYSIRSEHLRPFQPFPPPFTPRGVFGGNVGNSPKQHFGELLRKLRNGTVGNRVKQPRISFLNR